MTSPQLDLSDDFVRASDGLEPVTLRRRGGDAGSPGIAIATALRRAMTTHEAAASEGRYTASDVTWHLPAAALADRPRLGDLICDAAGARFVVLAVTQTALGSRWRCASRAMAILHGLDDAITVLQAVYTKQAGGAMEPSLRPWRTGIRARIQPAATEVGVQDQARQAVRRYHVFVEESLPLDHTHRIQGPDGTLYKVEGVACAERIGELSRIDVEVTPWP